MAWILEFCCECAQGRREFKKENELEAKKVAKEGKAPI
jgi:hypothetical protein